MLGVQVDGEILQRMQLWPRSKLHYSIGRQQNWSVFLDLGFFFKLGGKSFLALRYGLGRGKCWPFSSL